MWYDKEERNTIQPDRFSSPVFTGVKLMKYGIIGTAGHVDHGKTCLIRALTGIDTDRLKEEKKRGITIELGFAWMDFPKGERVGIVDVPGHEKFVKNMLAGVAGMDMVMLVGRSKIHSCLNLRKHGACGKMTFVHIFLRFLNSEIA